MHCIVAVGFGVLMMLLTFVAAELGGVLQVGTVHISVDIINCVINKNLSKMYIMGR